MLLRRRQKKIKIQILLTLIIFLFLGYFLVFLPLRRINKEAKIVYQSAKKIKETLNKNDINLLDKELKDFSNSYQKLEKEAKKIYWLSFIPYVSDFKNSIEAGRYLINAGQKAVIAVAPYADLLGFKKGEGSFVEKSAEDRLQTAVLTLDKMLVKVDPIANDIKEAEVRIEKINPNRYPKKIGNLVIKERIIKIKEEFLGLASLFVDAKPLLKKLPEILGRDGEKTYLILFQNDKELRATGGFLTAYALFRINNGKIYIDRSEDIYSLDNSISYHPVAPKEILTYHKGVNNFYIRDSNLSPDFPTSIKLFQSLYEKSQNKKDYQGIIALDSKVLVDMLKIFGDTEAGGIRFSANIDSRCNCPQVLYQLFDMVDRPVPYLKENRKGILGELMYALFYKAIGFSPSKYWGTLVQTMIKNLQEKHILLYFVDNDVQKAVEKLNFAGRIRDYKDDYLAVINVNFAGAKSNLFVSTAIDSVTKGREKTVTISYRNPYPHSDCNLERGGLCLNATLRDWLRVYVPEGSTLIDFQGSTKKVNTYNELGKTVFEGFLTVSPQGAAKVIIRYKLPERINPYNYLIQKQAGTYEDKLTVKFNNETVFKGVLDQDKEIIKK